MSDPKQDVEGQPAPSKDPATGQQEDHESAAAHALDDEAPAIGSEPIASAAEAAPEVDPLQAAQTEIESLRGKLARARADYDNLEKRHSREAALERDRVKARVLEHFLQVHEYSRLAAKEAEKSPGPLADGVTMLVREFDRLLETEGVTRTGAVGEPFDRAAHEAIAEQPSSDVDEGAIVEVVAPGYRLGERVLRFAKVVVSTGKPAQA